MKSKHKSCDVAIIGSGPGGYVAGIRAAQAGLKAIIIERSELGGICLNWGCIPTKALLASARLLDEMGRADSLGLTCADPAPDWRKVIAHSRQAASRMSKGVEYLLRKNKIEVVTGIASMEKPGEISVVSGEETNTVSAASTIIATGAHPRTPPGIEFDGKNIISYREAMVLPDIPKRLLIVGAGAIGVEFAWFYSVMGSDVTLVEMMDQLVPLEDSEVASTLARSFKKRGITVHTGSTVSGVRRNRRGAWTYTLETPNGAEKVTADVCLVATGVSANVDGLGLDELGVKLDRGFIKVNNYMRTSVDGVWAIGDCAGPPLLAHAASHEGICAAETIAGIPHPGIDNSNVPGCTYCHPQIASVGLTESAARDAGRDVRTGKYLFRANGRAVAGGETDGFVKFVIEAEFGEVLGVHIIGPGAPELIGEIVLGREFELTAVDFARTIHAHPTLSEASMEAAADALGEAIHI